MEKFTLEIIQDALVAAGDEMFQTLQRTSMSPIIYESLDYAVGITDIKGELLAQGNGVTAFLAALDSVVSATLEKFNGENSLQEGDIIIANTPYAGGGTHLSDVSVIYPVFYKKELVAFTVNKAHWTELGGTFPGSVSTVATEIYQEGLHFPFIKIKSEGKINDAIIDLIKGNVRLPESTLGDLYAGIAATEVGAKRVLSIIEKYGLETYKKAKNDFLDYGERMCIEALKEIPNGIYEGETTIEDNGFGEGPFPIKAKITVTDTEFIADFNGSHPQVKGATNLSFSGLVTGCRSLFKAITTPQMDANGGSFRPMKVICEPGTIVSAEAPSAVSVYYEVLITSIDLIWKILAPLIPDRLPAGHMRSVCATFISGIHPDTNQFYIQAEPLAGGWGASATHDGNRGQLSCGSGESYNIPIEIREMRYGIQVEQYAFHNEGGGYGEFQGGNGQYLDYKIVSDGAHVTAAFLGEKTKTWGMKNGHDGSYNYFMIIKKDGSKERHSLGTNIYLEKGDIVRCTTATGGGYGNPKNRPKAQVLLDVKNEYITKEEAKEFYNL
ncbi:MAG: hydantoinase B/oxoprolinase family protein [Flavobacteriales bacterium]|jgi:N-methylhydantoinase B|nr:hydantoinase B/oxoprolinase family protein [Polaribacter sp.]MDB9853548.1 hydantoinase B/oxoprolinase family protein [bacterium]|tara:strand:- start:5011 stop:6672 length:1662 start_codon:yes stop_codon:yes gene_type:complete